MSDRDFPESGDPQLLPKPLIERPSAQRMPFDAAGRLIPGGPRFPESRLAPDIKDFPWRRLPNDNWTSPAHRELTLEFIKKFFADNAGVFVTWRVVETLRPERSLLLRPNLLFTMIRREDRFEVETSAAFTDDERNDLAQFQLKIDIVNQCLLHHNSQNPVVESSC